MEAQFGNIFFSNSHLDKAPTAKVSYLGQTSDLKHFNIFLALVEMFTTLLIFGSVL